MSIWFDLGPIRWSTSKHPTNQRLVLADCKRWLVGCLLSEPLDLDSSVGTHLHASQHRANAHCVGAADAASRPTTISILTSAAGVRLLVSLTVVGLSTLNKRMAPAPT